jgi:hypothetical protein
VEGSEGGNYVQTGGHVTLTTNVKEKKREKGKISCLRNDKHSSKIG